MQTEKQAAQLPTRGRDSGAVRHMHQMELAHRWRVSHRTLQQWRWLGQGPRYVKVGGRVVYRLEDVEAFEAQQVRG